MKLIEPSFKIIEQEPELQGIFKQIELAGRVCYKSEDKITETSNQAFVQNLIKSKHYAMLEHGTVYLSFDCGRAYWNSDKYTRYSYNPYSKAALIDKKLYVTTNYRVLVEKGWLNDLRYITPPTEFHPRRVTVKFISSIGVTRELLRHRVFSFANESTRYCNYSKNKFGNEITYIIPSYLNLEEGVYQFDLPYMNEESTVLSDCIINHYKNGEIVRKLTTENTPSDIMIYLRNLIDQEDTYLSLLHHGWAPQQAREVLPLATKSELVMTGFVNDWKHVFKLRSYIAETGKPHPEMQVIMDELLHQFVLLKYINNEDI